VFRTYISKKSEWELNAELDLGIITLKNTHYAHYANVLTSKNSSQHPVYWINEINMKELKYLPNRFLFSRKIILIPHEEDLNLVRLWRLNH
jgi:hypothetical protein